MKSLEQQKINQLWQSWRDNDDPKAYEELVEHYMRLVEQIVNKMKKSLSNQVTFDELKSHGVIGLLDALTKFDPHRGLQFETYASLRIRGAILDGIRENDWIPRSIREKAKKIERAYQELEQKFLRSVSDLEVTQYLGMELDEFYQSIKETAFLSYISLDEPIDEEGENTRLSMLSDSRQVIEEKINQQNLKDILSKAIDRLPEKEKLVVSLYYYEELNLTEISEILELSTSRISQLHTKAIYRLRGSLSRQKKNIF
ncbi:FliA/WhiG family RNA polymerase sigma factor [Tepidibacillus infernus]|uniref:RNA polymerase subunit sigma n=1 Tax=Tepidibacillus decaturensis TaxID=1413211 RepID=A0A135L384_9BACI|nr:MULTISPECIES: FliA/WhiG family RNA polymerase sigma factor [Tepidibacillus]KXG43411.1 RNA polymerase subunit sigma [Tepidibacillus decaturensis]GBF11627.1 RNA polymerase sigma-D factor [Tepidibacillus sp. HK-1]